MLALPHQKIVVPARRLFGKIATRRRTMFIHGAVPVFLIEKHAHAFEDVIFAMPQHARLVRLFVLGEFRFGLFEGQAEAFGQPFDVAFVDANPVIRTTITGTFGTVITQPRLFRFFGSIGLKHRQFFFRHKMIGQD